MKDELKTVIKNLLIDVLIILAGVVTIYKLTNDLVSLIIFILTVIWVLFVVYVIFPIESIEAP